MSLHDELAFLDATAQAELARRKEIQPLELVAAAIERIERINPAINAVVTPMFDQAMEAVRKTLPDGPFAGVPFLLKDILASCAGVRMTLGSKLLQNFTPDHDSELVLRYKQAGFIILGKTNVPEFGILPTTEPALFGPCRNPWNTERTTGGSSGGSAAAVAAGMVPAAHGNDGGGSIRIPASCCGLFGLKPTRGRNPLGPDFGDIMNGIISEHVITRSVRDSAAILDATAGPAIGDPYWAPPKGRPYLQEIGAGPGRLRIGFTTGKDIGMAAHEDCIKAVQDAAALCSDLGHHVEEKSPSVNGKKLAEAFTVIWSAGNASTIKALRAKKEQVEPLTWALAEMGLQYDAADYLHAVQTIQRLSREISSFFVKYDIWLTPTLAEPPVPLGTFASTPDQPLRGFNRSGEFAPFTPICNATGQPAMSVPLFWNHDNLPVGTHFVGRFGDEATLFRLAAELEEARPWAGKRPPVSA
jgi:amidase